MLLPQRRPGVKGYELSTDPEMLKFSSYVFDMTNQATDQGTERMSYRPYIGSAGI